MKKLKKWLILFWLLFAAILIILTNKWDDDDGIKNRMKRRKIKMDDLRERESVLKEKIKTSDGNAMVLSGELLAVRKEKREIKKIVKDEIRDASSQEKAELLGKLLKDL